MAKRQYKYQSYLASEYWDKGKSITDIAKANGVCQATIRKWMLKLNVPRRDTAESVTLGKQSRSPGQSTYMNREWLHRKYSDGLSTLEIADMCGVSRSAIQDWLERHAIPRRSYSECQIARTQYAPAKEFNISRATEAILHGSLLSDGSIAPISRSASFHHTSKYYGYCLFLKQILSKDGIHSRIFTRDHGNGSFSYQLETSYYSNFLDWYNKWYSLDELGQRKKIVPHNIEFASSHLWLHLYLGDGTLKEGGNILFATCNFQDQCIERLRDALNSTLQVDSYYITDSGYPFLKLPVSDVPVFLEFVGPLPRRLYPIFSYKWDWKGTLSKPRHENQLSLLGGAK